MNKIKIVLIFIYITTFSLSVYSQETTIKRSNNEVELNGNPYYIHIVRKGETLYAISKAYNVHVDSIKKDNLHLGDNLNANQFIKIRIHKSSQDNKQQFVYHKVKKGDTPYNISVRYKVSLNDIYKYNPSAKVGIGIDEVIRIPLAIKPNTSNTDTTQLKTAKPESSDAYLVHKVEKKETIFGIAAKYLTTQEKLVALNPQLKEKSLQVGDELKIPVSEKERLSTNNDFYYHEVKKQETIYRLTRNYNIKEKEFYKFNPDLKDRSMQVGELVKIPKNSASDSIFNQKVENDSLITAPEPDNYVAWKDSLILPPCPESFIDTVSKYKVAFFLPFYLNINDTLGKFVDIVVKDEDGIETIETVPRTGKIHDKIYPRSSIFISFYQGALLALSNLKQQGINLEVHVFDTQEDTTITKELLKSNQLADFDLIIGPVFNNVLKIVADYAWENQINIVSPLASNNGFIDHNPYAFQVSPPLEIQMHHASDFLHSFDTKNYIVIHDGKNLDQEYISQFKSELFAQMNSENYDQVKYNEVLYYDAQDSVLKEVFTKGMENIVIVPSSNQAFVTDVLGKLNAYSYEYNLTIFGQPKWARFQNISLDNFHNTNTHIFSNSFIDYSHKNVIRFIKEFRLNFKDEPDKYAFSGYDITKYFCLALNKYGPDFRKCIHMHKPELLQTNFCFVPIGDQGGYQNTAIYLIAYNKLNMIEKVMQFPQYLDEE